MSLLVPLGRSEWSLFSFGGLRFGWEGGAEVRDGVSASFGVALGYQVHKTLSLQVGFVLVTRIEDSPFGFPLIGVRWRPNDWFRLETRGPGIEAGFKPIQALELFAAARYDNRQFRLDDRRAQLAGHILEDQEIVIEAGVNARPLEVLVIRGALGVAAYQEFEIRDARGETRFRARTEPAPYVELSLSLEF